MITKVLYYNTTSNSLYDEFGNPTTEESFSLFLSNKVSIELHYVTSYSETQPPSTWDKDIRFNGVAVASSIAIDDNMRHAYKGTLFEGVTEASTTAVITADEQVMNSSGFIRFYQADGTLFSVEYTAYTYTGGKYTFTLTNTTGIPTFAVGTYVRLSESLIISASGDDVDDSRAGEGIFTFNLYGMSKKLLELLDYKDVSKISSQMQHKVTSEGDVVSTFNFNFTIFNLLDYESEAEIPSTPDNPQASKVWVLSLFRSDVLFQFSEDGLTNWHDTQSNDDLYIRFKLDESGALWSNQVKMPKGPDGSVCTIGENGHWFIDGEDTGVVAEGKTVLAQYSADNSTWHDYPPVETDNWIRFSIDNGISWSSGQKYMGDDAPEVIQEFSVNGSSGWHSAPFIEGDNYTRFSTDNGSTYTGVIKVTPETLLFLYSESENGFFHADYVAGVDKWLKASVDGGLTYDSAKKFIGDNGASFEPDQIGAYIERSTYDNEAAGFSFLVVTGGSNEGLIYFRVTDTAGVWSSGVPFNPQETLVQYSANGTDWHDTVSTGDEYIRVSTDNGTTWGDALLVKGLKGDKGDSGDKGDPGDPLDNNFIEITALTDGFIQVEDSTIPVMLESNTGKFYSIEKETLTHVTGFYKIDPASYIAYENVATFTGAWKVWRAGGAKGADGTAGEIQIAPYAPVIQKRVLDTTYGYCWYLDDELYPDLIFSNDVVSLSELALRLLSADDTISGNIALVVNLDGVDTETKIVAVGTSITQQVIEFTTPITGALILRRDTTSASDTLKDGTDVITAIVKTVRILENL